jgi:mRNA interferase HigB
VDKNVLVRIIKTQKLIEFLAAHADSRGPLLKWFATTKKSRWKNLTEMRSTFSHADEVIAGSGKAVVVFNIKGNRYRLITAVHYEKVVNDITGQQKIVEGKVYLFYFLTHADYDKDKWKDQL